MTAKSIRLIDNIIEREKNIACDKLNKLRNELRQKYGEDFYDNLTEVEKLKFDGAKEKYNKMFELYQDFSKHQW